MIEAHQLTKRYGDKTAVEDLSFTVRPGIAKAVSMGRSAADHLRVMAATTEIGRGRVEVVIDLVGLREAAEKRAGTPERSTPSSGLSRPASWS